MDDILVTIYCLAYNHEKYIRQTLEGFILQKTNFKYEILIHDDASTDNTAQIIREYASKYDNIIPIFQKENQYSKNISISKEYMLPRVRGKYIAYCEGDDFWIDENKLQKCVAYLEEHEECSMVCHSYYLLNEKDERIKSVSTLECEGNISIEKLIEYKNPTQLASQVYRADIIKTMPDSYRNYGVGDYTILLYSALHGTVHYIDEIMACYRRGIAGSWTERVYKNPQKQLEHWEAMEQFLLKYNDDSNKKYQNVINRRIDCIKYSKAMIKNEYALAKSCNYYKEVTWKRKLLINIGIFFPKLAKNIEKLIRR